MNAHVPPKRGVNAAMLASFDLSIEEQIRHSREMLGRNEHDVERMKTLALIVSARADAQALECEKLRQFIALLEAQKTERQTSGSVMTGEGSPE